MTILTVDIRTPFQALKINEISDAGLLEGYKRMVILVPRGLKERLDLCLEYDVIEYDFIPSSYRGVARFFFFLIGNRRLLHRSDLLTAVNHGPWYRCIMLFTRRNTILYEDGISSFLKLRARFRFWNRFKFLYSRNYSYGIFDESILKLIPKRIASKLMTYKKNWCVERAEECNVFVSSSSVEYQLDSLEAYQERLFRLLPLIANEEAYISFHHNERLFSKKLDLAKKYVPGIKVIPRDMPLEEFFRLRPMAHVIAPYNSAALNLMRHFPFKRLTLYNDGGPNISKRVIFFKNISEQLKVDYYE